MAVDKNPLTPRETALRMLQHMHDDVSYGDIIRQLRILQDIDQTMNDVDLAGFPEDVLEEARNEISDAETSSTYPPEAGAIVLRSGSADPWESLSEKPDDIFDSLLRKAAWHY